MKNLIYLILSFLFCFSVYAQETTEYFNVGNPIKYCDSQYYLVWSTNPIENYYYLQEYLPNGESLEHYNQMLSISVIFWDKSPEEAVQAKIDELEIRKKTDPVTNYIVAENNGEYILEFIVSDSDSETFTTVEVNVHHYKQMTINERKAVVLCFYSARAYGDDIKPFIQSIPEKRVSWYEEMSKLKINPRFPKQ